MQIIIIIIHPFHLLSFYNVSTPHCQQSQSRLSNLLPTVFLSVAGWWLSYSHGCPILKRFLPLLVSQNLGKQCQKYCLVITCKNLGYLVSQIKFCWAQNRALWNPQTQDQPRKRGMNGIPLPYVNLNEPNNLKGRQTTIFHMITSQVFPAALSIPFSSLLTSHSVCISYKKSTNYRLFHSLNNHIHNNE